MMRRPITAHDLVDELVGIIPLRERAEPWDYAAMAIAESLAASIVGGRSSNWGNRTFNAICHGLKKVDGSLS